MAIGKSFEEVIQKAIRMCEIGKDGLVCNHEDDKIVYPKVQSEGVTNYTDTSIIEKVEYSLIHPDDEIIFNVVRAIKCGMSIEHINKLSSIDPWFLIKIKNVVDKEEQLKKTSLNLELLKEAKKFGFSDKQIGRCWSLSEDQVR